MCRILPRHTFFLLVTLVPLFYFLLFFSFLVSLSPPSLSLSLSFFPSEDWTLSLFVPKYALAETYGQSMYARSLRSWRAHIPRVEERGVPASHEKYSTIFKLVPEHAGIQTRAQPCSQQEQVGISENQPRPGRVHRMLDDACDRCWWD